MISKYTYSYPAFSSLIAQLQDKALQGPFRSFITDLQSAFQTNAVTGNANAAHLPPTASLVQMAAVPTATVEGALVWVPADGRSLSTATYSSLFAAIGYAYGGSGASFNVPHVTTTPPTYIKS